MEVINLNEVRCVRISCYRLAGKLAGEAISLHDVIVMAPPKPEHLLAALGMEHADFGFRSGDRGTMTSRTMMLAELEAILDVVPPEASRQRYAAAIVEENAAGKRTASSRRLTNQRLGELYGLSPEIPIFRVMRLLWDIDSDSRPLLAMLCALARDPLLRATAPAVLGLQTGVELSRQSVADAVRDAVGDRLNDSTLDKVVRNSSSSWTQSGHLAGRVRKLRRRVDATPVTVTFALVLGYFLGLRGEQLFSTLWAATLDRDEDEMAFLAMDAKRHGLLNLQRGGGVTSIDLSPLLTKDELRACHGTH
ncbi:MAG: hypothetical protein ACOC3G_03620 [Phycisphaeraceae bacterium]